MALAKVGDPEGALASYEMLAAEYGEDRDSRIARRVTWAMWNSTGLLKDPGCEAEREALYERIAARRVEGVEDALDAHIAWCLYHRAARASDEGDDGARTRACAELVERFANATAPWVIRQVLDGLLLNAGALRDRGSDEAEIEIYDDIVTRFGDIADLVVREQIVEALRRKGKAMGRVNRHDEAIRAFDSGLALVAESPDALNASLRNLLVSKGVELESAGEAGEAEALVMYDSAIAAYIASEPASKSSQGLLAMDWTLTRKIDRLCGLGRSDEADGALDQLVELLGDVTPPTAESNEPVLDEKDEIELARVFTDVFASGECWQLLDPPRLDLPADELAARAVDLYRLTDPWSLDDQGGMPVQAAVGTLRDIADGYALLSTNPSPGSVTTLPLPRRSLPGRDEMLERFGVSNWLVAHDLPALPEVGDREDDFSEMPDRVASHDANVVLFFLRAIHVYGLRLTLCDSPTGRAILSSPEVRAADCAALATARSIAGALGPEHALAPLAFMCILIGRGLFMSSHTQPASSRDIHPSRETLSELLEIDARARIAEEGGTLPRWLDLKADNHDDA